MNELQILFRIGPFAVTGYSLCLMLGCLLAVGAALLMGRRDPGTDKVLTLCLVALPCALVGARLVYVLTQLDTILLDTEFYGMTFILSPWQGGYTLYGAVLGALAGVWLSGKLTHVSFARLLDVLSPGLMLCLCVLRLGEYFTQQGLGHYIEEEAQQFFPLAVEGVWGSWQQPVFVYEAAAALGIFVVLAVMAHKKPAKGQIGMWMLTLLSASQVFLESLREDECIRFGFVRFTQLAAALTLAVVLARRLLRWKREGGWTRALTVRTVLFILEVAVCIGVEFALDKSSIDNSIIYAVMALDLTGLCFTVLLPHHSGHAEVLGRMEHKALGL